MMMEEYFLHFSSLSPYLYLSYLSDSSSLFKKKIKKSFELSQANVWSIRSIAFEWRSGTDVHIETDKTCDRQRRKKKKGKWWRKKKILSSHSGLNIFSIYMSLCVLCMFSSRCHWPLWNHRARVRFLNVPRHFFPPIDWEWAVFDFFESDYWPDMVTEIRTERWSETLVGAVQ